MGKFFKLASSYIDATSWEQVAPYLTVKELEKAKQNNLQRGQVFPQGQMIKSTNSNKYLIMMDPDFYRGWDGELDKDLYKRVHAHELTHAIRAKQGKLSARMADSSFSPIKAIGTFIEEIAAQRRGLKRETIPFNKRLVEYIYPFEAASGALINKHVKFNKLKNIIRNFK